MNINLLTRISGVQHGFGKDFEFSFSFFFFDSSSSISADTLLQSHVPPNNKNALLALK